MKNFIAFLFMSIFSPLYGQSILGESVNNNGVRGISSTASGVFGSSNPTGVQGLSTNSFRVFGTSNNGIGASFLVVEE